MKPDVPRVRSGETRHRTIADAAPLGGRRGTVVKLGELVMILDLHRQGLSVSAISRQLGIDRKTVRRYVARGLEPPKYKPRVPQPGVIDPFRPYLAERITSFPALTARRLWRELKDRGYRGAAIDFR